MSNSIKVIISLLIIMSLYGYFRYSNISKLKNEMENLDKQIKQTNMKFVSYQGMKSDFANIDTISFIEKVLEIAKQEKIEKINILNKSKGMGEKKDKISKNVIAINIEDNYRKTVEFIREINNLNLNFIVSKIEMTSIDKGIKTNIMIELLPKGN